MFTLSITLITILFHDERHESCQPFLGTNRVDCFNKINFFCMSNVMEVSNVHFFEEWFVGVYESNIDFY
jgi:hypothetical protein